MTDTDAREPQGGGPSRVAVPNRSLQIRWFIASATLNVPQATGPVAFSLVALSLTGRTNGGAAMILAMTLAQVVGAVPVTRLTGRLPSATAVRLLVCARTLALAAIVLAAAWKVPFAWLVPLAAIAGLVNGAAFGHLRSVLNEFTPSSRLPRALGIAATLNELTFVLGPVAASGLGTLSPVLALLALTILGAVPALAVPRSGSAQLQGGVLLNGRVVNAAILLWLLCAAAGSAAIAMIEIGAVALALNFGYPPAMAILFTVPLCVASVLGGVWTSVRNRLASRRIVIAQLAAMSLGSALAALGDSVYLTVAGAVLIGLVLAPLATHYSLVLDALAPAARRPEVFALLRTANAIGIIIASALLTVVPLSAALMVVTCLILAVTAAVAGAARNHV